MLLVLVVIMGLYQEFEKERNFVSDIEVQLAKRYVERTSTVV